MKANILKSATFVALILLAACAKEGIESPENNGLSLGQGEDVIRISLSNTSATRAARPIGSSEAKNSVNRLVFKFLTEDQQEVEGITLAGVIDAEGELESGYEVAEGNILKLPNSYDGQELRVKFNGLTEGVYKIIAYGYNYTAGVDNSEAFPYTVTLQGEKHLLKCENVTTVQEIFAGSNQNGSSDVYVEVNQHDKFTKVPEITLKRQVAGLLAYFKNAPVFVHNEKVAKITVSSKTNVTAFSFPASLLDKPSYNGFALNRNDWYGAVWVDYLTFDLSNASNYTDQHLEAGDYYKFDNKHLLAEGMTEISGLVCEANTLFGSCFLLAYPQHIDLGVEDPKCATLNICYWNENGELILSVPLRSGGNADDLLNSTSYQYDIKCNNFYSIGKKKTGDNSDGQDNPIDIDESTGYDYADVSIDSEWDNTHDLFN